MLKMNKKVEYALMALKFIADKEVRLKNTTNAPALTSAREICDEFNIPFDTTAKVMQLMNNHDVLTSVKGIKGGYFLSTPLSKISYIDLVTMIEGKENIGRVCHGPNGNCDLLSKCNIATPVEKLNDQLFMFLSKLNLEELLLTHSIPRKNNLDSNLSEISQ